MTNNKFNIFAGLLLTAILSAQFSCGKLQKTEFDRNRKLWNDSKITNYKMTIKIDKTGHATPNGKFTIIVRDGVAESIKMFDKPEMDMLQDSVIKFGRYATIDGIFAHIEIVEKEKNENNRSWSRRITEYDTKFGYPKKVDMDQSGVFDDELYFEVLEFEEVVGVESKKKTSLPKSNSVSAAEITKAEFSDRSHAKSDESFTDWSGMSFSNDGTAFRSHRSRNIYADDDESPKWQKYQGVASQEQFQKLAQTIADNDFSNLEDSTEPITHMTDYLTITYSGKTKSIRTSNIGKDTAEVRAILQAFETLKNQLDWKEIK